MDCIRFSPGESICRATVEDDVRLTWLGPGDVNRKATRLDRVQPTVIGSPPASFRWREIASVPNSASILSAEREHGIKKTDQVRRLKNAIAVGTPITGRPPHRTVRAAFLHTAPTSDV